MATERSERSSSGKSGGQPAAPERGAPGHATSTADAGAAPPLDPDDDGDARDGVDAAASAELAIVRAEPWVPDASLMRAFGLDLDELRPRADAGEPDLSDDPVRPAPAAPRVEAEARVSGDEGRLPWW